MSTKKQIRYGVVGAGWISQGSFMPGVAHTGNSVMTALVTGDQKKGQELAKHYGIEHVYHYDNYRDLLSAGIVDALYIALPNEMHKEYTIPALDAGIHVLLEKPMAVSSQECEEMTAAAKRNKVKLMVAYRLHNEPATLAAIDRVKSGEIGEPRYFSAIMGQMVEKNNHRAKQGFWAGPVADMGPYPINAARHLFDAEPIEIMATGAKNPDVGFEFHDTVSVTMKFPKEKLAQFTVSYSSAPIGFYHVTGSEAHLMVNPGFNWGKPLEHFLTKDGNTEKRSFPETDHFGGETKYFSDCIMNNKQPEADGEEGLCDVRIIEAIEQALKTGKPQQLAPYTRHRKPESSQAVKLPPIKEPSYINAAPPGGQQAA